METFPTLQAQRTATVYHKLLSAVFIATCLALMMLLNTSAAQAKECEDSNCNYIQVYNCTKEEFKIQFKLCCWGEIVVTDCQYVPADGCDTPVAFSFPHRCSVVGVGFCHPLPRGIGYYWDPVNCFVKIYYL